MRWLVGTLIVLLIIIIAPFALMMLIGLFSGFGGGFGFGDDRLDAQREALVALAQDAGIAGEQADEIDEVLANPPSDSPFGDGYLLASKLEGSGLFEYLALQVLHDEHIAPALDDVELVEAHQQQVHRFGYALLEHGLDQERADAYLTLYFLKPAADGYVRPGSKRRWYPKRRPRDSVNPETVEEMVSQLRRLGDAARVPEEVNAPDAIAALRDVLEAQVGR